jgi:hypothetical protein
MAPTRSNEQNSSSDNPSFHMTLSASYTNSSTSPPTTHQFSYPISAPIPTSGSTSIKDKTAYLCGLRKSAKRLQDEVNTQKMEEDKLHAMKNVHDGQEKAGTKTADEAEEENYGEEGVEDDEED